MTQLDPLYTAREINVAVERLAREILSSEVIICRSGYSTIMDLVALNRTALLVPTPGQTEQEYLAEYLSSAGYFRMMEQENFELFNAIGGMRRFKSHPFPRNVNGNLLGKEIKALLGSGTLSF